MSLKTKLRREIGMLLMYERCHKRFGLRYTAKRCKMSPEMLDSLEQGCNGANWRQLERVMAFYKKDIRVMMIDSLPSVKPSLPLENPKS